ncbi:hypothetical protein [Fulvitalea axinellae]
MPKGSLQVEAGVDLNEKYYLGNVRYGLFDGFELSTNIQDMSYMVGDMEFSDPHWSIGGKFNIFEGEGTVSQISLYDVVGLPLFGDGNVWENRLGVALTSQLGETSYLAGNVHWSMIEAQKSSIGYSLQFGTQFSRKGWGLYAEHFGQYYEFNNLYTFGGLGLTYSFGDKVQADIGYVAELEEFSETSSAQIQLGLSVRLF